MATRKVRRSKTFNTYKDGKVLPGFKQAYAFKKKLPKKAEAWMESYVVGTTARAVVYWYEHKKVKKKPKTKKKTATTIGFEGLW